MTFTKHIIRQTTAACAVALLALGAQAQDKPVELKFAHWLQAATHWPN